VRLKSEFAACVRRLVIGLFGLVGMFGVSMSPLLGHFVDGLAPWFAILVSTTGMMLFWAIQFGAAGVHVSAVIVVCLGLDLFDAMQQVSLAAHVFRYVCARYIWQHFR